jgi:hypothetical protein
MAVNTTILTSPARVKTDTPLNDSVDDNLLYPAIVTAQERNCHPLLGTDLFNKLKTLISAGEVGDPGNESYETLLNVYLVPMLVQYTFAEVLPVLRLRFLNNSVVAMGSEQSTTASYDELKPIMNSANEIGNFYKERAIDYLCYNAASFPEYTSNSGADLSPTNRNYTQGMNLGPSWNMNQLSYIRTLLGFDNG